MYHLIHVPGNIQYYHFFFYKNGIRSKHFRSMILFMFMHHNVKPLSLNTPNKTTSLCTLKAPSLSFVFSLSTSFSLIVLSSYNQYYDHLFFLHNLCQPFFTQAIHNYWIKRMKSDTFNMIIKPFTLK